MIVTAQIKQRKKEHDLRPADTQTGLGKGSRSAAAGEEGLNLGDAVDQDNQRLRHIQLYRQTHQGGHLPLRVTKTAAQGKRVASSPTVNIKVTRR
jgi:hypothetical protein